MYRRLVFASIFVALLALMTSPVFAQGTVDFNLFICQSCTTAPSSPTLLTNLSSFNVGDAGNHATQGPLLIIVGTYNGAPAPTLSFGSNTTITPGATVPAGGLYGWNGSASGTTFSAADGMTNAYTKVGIAPPGGGSSEQFGNWNGAEGLGNAGIAPATSFTLYVYEIPGAVLPAMGVINLDMTGGTRGDFVIGYSCETTDNPCPDGSEGATPFTTSGIVGATQAPEPGSLMLLGTGLIGLVGFARRRLAA